jgi:hypothetical protein
MTCQVHRGLCGYPDESPDRCSFCHANWDKITGKATYVTTRPGQRGMVIEDVHYTGCYGETPLAHLWRHALSDKRSADSRNRAAKAAA